MIELAPETPIHSVELTELFAWTCTHNNKYDWRVPTKLEQRQARSSNTRLATVYHDDVETETCWVPGSYTAKFIPVRDL